MAKTNTSKIDDMEVKVKIKVRIERGTGNGKWVYFKCNHHVIAFAKWEEVHGRRGGFDIVHRFWRIDSKWGAIGGNEHAIMRDTPDREQMISWVLMQIEIWLHSLEDN